MLELLLSEVSTWKGAGVALLAVLSWLGLVLGTGAVRRRRVALAVYHAYQVVEDVKAEAAAEGRKLAAAEKVAEGLYAADAWMVANGWRALKAGEQERARLEFRALHGERCGLQLQEGALTTALATVTGESPSSSAPPGRASSVAVLALLLPLAGLAGQGCTPLHVAHDETSTARATLELPAVDYRLAATDAQCAAWDSSRLAWGTVSTAAGALGAAGDGRPSCVED